MHNRDKAKLLGITLRTVQRWNKLGYPVIAMAALWAIENGWRYDTPARNKAQNVPVSANPKSTASVLRRNV